MLRYRSPGITDTPLAVERSSVAAAKQFTRLYLPRQIRAVLLLLHFFSSNGIGTVFLGIRKASVRAERLRLSRQTEIIQRRASCSVADVRIDDQFKYSNA